MGPVQVAGTAGGAVLQDEFNDPAAFQFRQVALCGRAADAELGGNVGGRYRAPGLPDGP
jgi:hypothetical protein